MTGLRRSGRVLAGLAVLVVLLASGCAPERGGLAPPVDLGGESYTVGGKEFNEQLVLCKVTVLALESAGASVTDRCGIVGTDETRAALLGGQIDMYWEYTGTGWLRHLNLAGADPDPDTLYRNVAAADLRAHDVVWLPPTPMNDTYTFAIEAETARRENIRTFSDMARVLSTPGDRSTVCLEVEFRDRPDGWLPMQRVYGFASPPPDRVRTLPLNDVYPRIGEGRSCSFGEVYSTDGRISQFQLTALRDDKNLLPDYNASLTVRGPVFNRRPDLAGVIKPITDAVTDPVMLDLNTQVANGADPEDVARRWLRSIGYLSGS